MNILPAYRGPPELHSSRTSSRKLNNLTQLSRLGAFVLYIAVRGAGGRKHKY